MIKDSGYRIGEFLYGIPSSEESTKYNPEDERVFIHDGTVDADGYGILIGFEDGKLVHSTGYGNFCWGDDVRLATNDEINQFISKIHNNDKISYRR